MRRALVLLLIGALAACSTPTKPVSEVNADPHASHRTFSAAPPAPLRDGERFLELSMARPFTPTASNGATDEYRCFLIDRELAERAFITGSQFLPENADLVHHAIFFRVKPTDVAKATKMDADAGGDGWTCFGGTGVGSDTGGRAAGGAGGMDSRVGARRRRGGPRVEDRLRDGAGQPHHHADPLQPALGQGQAGRPDRSGIRLRLMEGKAGLKPLQTTLLPAPVELPCAAGESGPLCERKLAVINVQERFGNQAGVTVAGSTCCAATGPRRRAPATQRR